MAICWPFTSARIAGMVNSPSRCGATSNCTVMLELVWPLMKLNELRRARRIEIASRDTSGKSAHFAVERHQT